MEVTLTYREYLDENCDWELDVDGKIVPLGMKGATRFFELAGAEGWNYDENFEGDEVHITDGIIEAEVMDGGVYDRYWSFDKDVIRRALEIAKAHVRRVHDCDL